MNATIPVHRFHVRFISATSSAMLTTVACLALSLPCKAQTMDLGPLMPPFPSPSERASLDAAARLSALSDEQTAISTALERVRADRLVAQEDVNRPHAPRMVLNGTTFRFEILPDALGAEAASRLSAASVQEQDLNDKLDNVNDTIETEKAFIDARIVNSRLETTCGPREDLIDVELYKGQFVVTKTLTDAWNPATVLFKLASNTGAICAVAWI